MSQSHCVVWPVLFSCHHITLLDLDYRKLRFTPLADNNRVGTGSFTMTSGTNGKWPVSDTWSVKGPTNANNKVTQEYCQETTSVTMKEEKFLLLLLWHHIVPIPRVGCSVSIVCHLGLKFGSCSPRSRVRGGRGHVTSLKSPLRQGTCGLRRVPFPFRWHLWVSRWGLQDEPSFLS